MQPKIKNYIKKFLKYFTGAVTTVLLLVGLLFLLVYLGVFGALPNQNDLAAINNEEASQVISSDSILIGKFFAENRTNIHWDEVPIHLKNALVATEDKRFYTHEGYDTQSYFRVLLKSIFLGDASSGGGSTLTQQLIKNLYGRNDFGFLSLPVNKIKELIIAFRIEKIYTKQELLVLYLNSVPFGENVYGIETASRRYFNKPANQLKIEEAAVLVGILKANTYFNPRLNPENSLERRNLILSLMEKQQYLSAKEVDSLQKLPLKLDYENIDLNATAGYFVYQVKKQTLELLKTVKTATGNAYNLETDGLKIYTTLNMQVQELATAAIQKQLSKMQQLLDEELENHQFKKQWYAKQKEQVQEQDLQQRNVEVFDWDGMQTKNISKVDSLWHYYKMLHAAVLITNPKNGAVISWVGGNHFRTLPFDMVLSHRQIASAFKPILYATALQNGFEPCTYLENEERIYTEYEDWNPNNFDHISTPDKNVALWYALANSMNLPTVDLYFKLGREKLLNTCYQLNFPLAENDGPSIALGTLDLSLDEIVKAYGAFANEGQTNELVMIDKITDAQDNILYKRDASAAKQVFNIETSQLITAILEQAINQGTGTKIRTQYGVQADLAGKTGTAQNYSDAWFVAYTPDLVLGTWVGASTPDVHFYSGKGSGSSLALPIVGQVLNGIEKDTTLRNRYLTSFALPDAMYNFMQCEPYREKGIGGFFNRLFHKEADKEKDKEEKKPEKKSFFDKLFKRNN